MYPAVAKAIYVAKYLIPSLDYVKIVIKQHKTHLYFVEMWVFYDLDNLRLIYMISALSCSIYVL